MEHLIKYYEERIQEAEADPEWSLRFMDTDGGAGVAIHIATGELSEILAALRKRTKALEELRSWGQPGTEQIAREALEEE